MSTINQKFLKELVYGVHAELREKLINQISEDRDFQHISSLELTRPEMRHHSFKILKKFHKMINCTFEDYKTDQYTYFVYGDALFSFDQGQAASFGVHFQLYLKSLINFGTEKHVPLIQKAFALDHIG